LRQDLEPGEKKLVSLDEFKKALKSLSVALAAPKTDITRDATIQRFEFCVELAWKSAKKQMGTVTTAPKQVVREMAQNELIADVDFWLRAIDYRNLSVHTYNQQLAEQVYGFAKDFLPAGNGLLKKLAKE
jgi:nucleotidyltransferase substrate binding protein (TIGR01987 family)